MLATGRPCAALGVGAISGAIQTTATRSKSLAAGLIGFGVKLYFTAPRLITGSEEEEPHFRLNFARSPKTFFLTITNGRGAGAIRNLRRRFNIRRGGVNDRRADNGGSGHAVLPGGYTSPSCIRHRFTYTRVAQINRIAGALLFGFGAILIGELVLQAAGYLAAAFSSAIA